MATFERGIERIAIELVDRTIVTRTSRGDTLVDEVSEQASSVLVAKWEADRRGRELVEQGFTRIAGESTAPSQLELIAALEANPDDLETYLVYADWLSERGEPWGQLIATQHALATLPRHGVAMRRGELEREESKLLFQHGAKLWGALGETIVNEATQTYASDLLGPVWRCGFVRKITVDARADQSGLFAQLARLDIMRLLESITINSYGWTPGELEAFAAERWPHLRELVINTEYLEPGELALDAARLVPVVDGLVAPRLADLMVMVSRSTDVLCHALAASPLANQLRSIVLYRGNFTEAGIGAFARTRFGALERLSLTGIGPRNAAMTLRSAAKQVMIDLRDAPGGADDDE